MLCYLYTLEWSEEPHKWYSMCADRTSTFKFWLHNLREMKALQTIVLSHSLKVCATGLQSKKVLSLFNCTIQGIRHFPSSLRRINGALE